MNPHTDHQTKASNMTTRPLRIRDKLYRSCQLSSTVSPKIFNSMAIEISSLTQPPFSQYTTDASSRGDLLRNSSKVQFPTSLKQEEKVIDEIFAMTLATYQHVQQHMAMKDPSAASQHIITFQLSPAVNNGHTEQTDAAESDDDNDSEYEELLNSYDGIQQNPTPLTTTHVLKDSNPFNGVHRQNNKYEQRECRLYHILVNLQKNVYHKYSVTSIIAPYGVIEGKQRGYLLYKAADLYPSINNSIQFLYTSMMGMVYLDAVSTTNYGDKLSKRIMTIADLVSFVSTCFGLSQQSENIYTLQIEAKWNSLGVKMQTDWEYIKYVAATYGKSVSDSFKELVMDAIIDYNPNYRSPSHPSSNVFIQAPLSYHIQQDEIHSLLQMMDILPKGVDVHPGDHDKDEKAKDDLDDESDVEGRLAMLNEFETQNKSILKELDDIEWQYLEEKDVQDPYMESYDFPEDINVMISDFHFSLS